MLTVALPPNTALSGASALMLRRFFLSCRPFFLMYAHSFFVTSVRGIPFEPTTAASVASGCTGFMKAAFGFRPDDFFFLATAISLVEGRSTGVGGACHETSHIFSNSQRGNVPFAR